MSSFPGFADIISAIDAGQVDATCSNDGLVNWTVKKSGGKYRAAAELGAPEDDSIGLPQGDFVWWMWLNRFVHEINEDGTNYTLWHKWFGDVAAPPFVKAEIAVLSRFRVSIRSAPRSEAVNGVYDFNLRVLYPYLPTLGWGAVQTLEISALAILLSFPLGLIGALMRISGSRCCVAPPPPMSRWCAISRCSSCCTCCFTFCRSTRCRSTRSPPACSG